MHPDVNAKRLSFAPKLAKIDAIGGHYGNATRPSAEEEDRGPFLARAYRKGSSYVNAPLRL
jgi:hypothetical protein